MENNTEYKILRRPYNVGEDTEVKDSKNWHDYPRKEYLKILKSKTGRY